MEFRSSVNDFREQNKMNVCCSFKSLVGGQCSFDRRDRSQSIEIVPLLSCSKDITRHKSLWQFQDVKSEVDLILARAAMFTLPQNVNTMTICPSHRSSLGLGWTRRTERCRVPPEISEHRNVRGKSPKADRGINKNFSQFIMKRTGHLVHVGSGRYFDVPLVLILFTCMQAFWPTSDCFRNVQKMQGNIVFIF